MSINTKPQAFGQDVDSPFNRRCVVAICLDDDDAPVAGFVTDADRELARRVMAGVALDANDLDRMDWLLFQSDAD